MIRVNGLLAVAWEPGMTVEGLLHACGFTYPLVVVSINGIVVPRERFSAAVISDGDEVRVLHLMAGG